MRFISILALLYLITLTLGCEESHATQGKISHYAVNHPSKVWELPAILKEISGISILDQKTVASVQDEKGIAFIYDMASKKITKELQFGDDGDYEDIELVGGSLYILRSDGAIIELANYKSKNMKTTIYETNIPAKDNEALCYDKTKNVLLIGTKSKIRKGIKGIYSFDLSSKKLSSNPILEFNVNKLDTELNSRGIKIKNKKGKLKLKIAAIAINPINKNLYVLSASEYLLFVFSPEGKLLEVAELDPKIYEKAEGIAFYENGDMLISSEGVDEQAKIVQIGYVK